MKKDEQQSDETGLAGEARQDDTGGTDSGRRRFLHAAGAVAVAVPAMETLSAGGVLMRSAKAQTPGGGMGGNFT